MAEFSTRIVTVTRYEWRLRNDSSFAEYDKMRSSALNAWEREHPDTRFRDDALRVTSDGEYVILFFEKEQQSAMTKSTRGEHHA